MIRFRYWVIGLLLLLCSTHLMGETTATNNITEVKKTPIILRVETSMGDFFMQLNEEKAPVTCKNFMSYVNDKYYDNTIIHRVIDGFLIQGGGFEPGFKPKPIKMPVENEAKHGLSNLRGTVGMALTTDKNSASSQFYINVADNLDLDFEEGKPRGYTVFSEIIDGMDVIDKIKKVRTRRISFYSETYQRSVPLYDVPEYEILIKKISILN